MVAERGNGYKDMVGQRFGRLTVIRDSGERLDKRVLWECLCDCGETSFVIGQNLRKGNTRSCGCFRKECYGKSRFIDRTGQRFGRLTVLRKDDIKLHRIRWLCKCDCGNEKVITGNDMVSKHVTSCGCYQLESRSGENCHLWKGGISKEPYSFNWNGTLKKRIRERDNYTCRICGKRPEGEELSIHHIDYNKRNLDENNLISLCRSCHIKTNHKRNSWSLYFQWVRGYWRCYE